MPFVIPILAGLGIAGWSFFGGAEVNQAIQTHPYEVQGQNMSQSLNLTTVAGYLVAGGLALYFGKKVLKA